MDLHNSDSLASKPTIDARLGGAVAPKQKDVNTAVEETLGPSVWKLQLRPMAFEAGFVHELNGLSSLSDGRNVFFEAEFQMAAQDRVLPPATKQLVLTETVGEETGMRLYLPVHLTRIGFPATTVWRVASHPFGPLSTPLLEYSDREEICARFAALIGRLPALKGHPLVFEDAAIGDELFSQMQSGFSDAGHGVGVSATHTRAVLHPIAADKPGETFERNALATKRRKELARLRRRLEEYGSLEFERAENFETVRLWFEEFLLLETRSWKGRRGTSLHIIRKNAAFARQTVAALSRQKRAIICSLRLDGRPIASIILLRSGNRFYPWKTAFDENYASSSPGAQLIIAMSRYLVEKPGFALADSLATGDSWIDHLWRDRLEIGTFVVATQIGVGDAAQKCLRAVQRRRTVREWAKRTLRRK